MSVEDHDRTGSRAPRFRLSRRRALPAGGSAHTFGLPAWRSAIASDAPLPAGIASVMRQPRYHKATWSLLVADLETGATIDELNPDHLALTGSARKLFSVGLAVERQTLIDHVGLQPHSFAFPTNGSGSPDSEATPRAVVQLLTAMARTDVAAPYRSALPTLGVDGSLAESARNLPARGHVFATTGTTAADGALKAQNLAGYIDAKSGRRLAFALFLNDAGPIQRISDVSAVFEDEARITNAIYEAC